MGHLRQTNLEGRNKVKRKWETAIVSGEVGIRRWVPEQEKEAQRTGGPALAIVVNAYFFSLLVLILWARI